MAIKTILLLGNPKLYQLSETVKKEEVENLKSLIRDLHDTLIEFRRKYGIGRAIAAPQIEVMKRVIYMHIDDPVVFINPVIDRKSRELIEIWDDCMSFPDLLVKVLRHKSCRITYRDLNWEEKTIQLEDDLSELLQHECDHLDGILAVSRAIDGRSLVLKSQSK
ncbi:MAG TPA: peptide deformylase, partial [Terriglobales bacterium]|nr:peptide deformylase [Terriglobales bacterium]